MCFCSRSCATLEALVLFQTGKKLIAAQVLPAARSFTASMQWSIQLSLRGMHELVQYSKNIRSVETTLWSAVQNVITGGVPLIPGGIFYVNSLLNTSATAFWNRARLPAWESIKYTLNQSCSFDAQNPTVHLRRSTYPKHFSN